MKPIIEPARRDLDAPSRCAIQIRPSETKPDASSEDGAPKRFRRLEASELVSHGDFVLDNQQALELWDGPTGFRADAFVKSVYRSDESGPFAASDLT